MNSFSRLHRTNDQLRQDVKVSAAGERAATASFLADIAEYEFRKLHLAEGCDSTYAFCVRDLHLSEWAALKRIRVARQGRKFPVIFEALADGRLHLAGVVLLAPHLTPENVTELVRLATHRTKRQIEKLIANRFPGQAPPERCIALPMTSAVPQLAPGPVQKLSGEAAAVVSSPTLAAGAEPVPPPPITPAPAAPPRLTPVAPRTYSLQATLDEEAYENLQRAQELLGRASITGSLGDVLGKALKLLVADLEKKKFAATLRPLERSPRKSGDPRHIPARVKRAVAKRDGNRCAFVGDNGKRCDARHGLEFDHVVPIARGGESNVANLRLLCRAHNQFVAERTFGVALMNGRRLTATEARASATATPARPH